MRKAPKGGKLHELDDDINRIIAMGRARVEHPFRVLKRQFGDLKTRYRGLDWPAEPPCIIDSLEPDEIERTLRIANRHEAVRNTVDMFVSRLVAENNRLESVPQFWFVVIPEKVYELGRPKSTVRRDDRVVGEVTISQRRTKEL